MGLIFRGSEKNVTFSSNMVKELRAEYKEAKKREKKASCHQSYYEGINKSHTLLEQLDILESGYLVRSAKKKIFFPQEIQEFIFYWVL